MTRDAEKLLQIACNEYTRRVEEGDSRRKAREFQDGKKNLSGLFSEWKSADFYADLFELKRAGLVDNYKFGGFALHTEAIEYFENSTLPETALTTTNNFNFGNAQIGNAVIGNQQNVTMNIGNGLDDVYQAIISKPLADQKLLLEMLEELKRIERNGKPIEKGMLSRFADGVDKFSDIVIAVGGFLAGFIFK